MSTAKDPSRIPGRRPRGRPATLDRARVLDVAAELIADRGLERTRYADVAAAAGVAVSTLQGAFKSREALLIAALERSSALDLEAATARASTGSAWERLEDFFTTAIAGEEERSAWLLWLELWRAAARDPGLSRHAQGLYDRWIDLVAGIIAAGVRDGEFATTLEPRTAARMALGVMDGAAISLIIDPTYRDYEQALSLTLGAAARVVERR